jgi:tryptophan-rich sensory protein
MEKATTLTSMAKLATLGAIVAATAAAGAVTTKRHRGLWFRRLKKPPFNPPDAVFAPVWTALYAMMTISAWRIARQPPSRARSAALALWSAQLAANGIWPWIFFRRRRRAAALGDLAALVVLVAAYAAAARRTDRVAAGLILPYLGWTLFAAALNEEIVRRNR